MVCGWLDAESLIRDYCGLVIELAQALYEKQHLSEPEVLAICEKA